MMGIVEGKGWERSKGRGRRRWCCVERRASSGLERYRDGLRNEVKLLDGWLRRRLNSLPDFRGSQGPNLPGTRQGQISAFF